MRKTLLILGLGNRLRGDDAVGLVLAEALRPRLPPTTELRLMEQADPLELAHDLTEEDGPLLAIDCASMGLMPGEWRLFPWDEAVVGGGSAISTHGAGLPDALHLAAALGRKGKAWLFGVEPGSLDHVEGLSIEVERRLPEMVAALCAGIDLIAGREQ